MKILNKTQVEALIKSISGRAGKLDKDVQLACVSIHAHIAEHGDHTLATRLVAALSAGQRRNTLIAWFEMTTWLTWDNKVKEFTKDKAKMMLGTTEASRIFWTEVQKETEYRPFKAESALKTLARKVKADREKELPVDQELVKFMDGVRELAGLAADQAGRERELLIDTLTRRVKDLESELASARQVTEAVDKAKRQGRRAA